jgi:hypothetical protein
MNCDCCLIVVAQLMNSFAIHQALAFPSSPIAQGANENESALNLRDWMIAQANTVPGVRYRQIRPQVMMWKDLSMYATREVFAAWKYQEWHAEIRASVFRNQLGMVCSIQGRDHVNNVEDSIVTVFPNMF